MKKLITKTLREIGDQEDVHEETRASDRTEGRGGGRNWEAGQTERKLTTYYLLAWQ